ncbi:MAG TPA: ABC transporter permease [Stellaceae bacterium]|nr:ABC transporter permease [Stellaceae bacterium]
MADIGIVAAAAPERGFWRSREGMLVLPALAFYALVYVYPLFRLAAWSFFDNGFTLKFYGELFGEPTYFRALANTLEISFLVTLVCLLAGYPLAYLMATTSPAARRVVTILVLVPFWTSILVRTFAWIVILGKVGLVNRALIALGLIGQPLKLVFNMIGVQIGMVHVLLPFMVFPLYGVMSRIDPNLVRTARSLGAGPGGAFRHVFLPLSLPGVAAGCVLVFLLAIGFYVTPALLGGPGEITLATMIDMMINTLLNWGLAATLGVLLLVVVGAIFVLFSRLMGLSRIVGGGDAAAAR